MSGCHEKRILCNQHPQSCWFHSHCLDLIILAPCEPDQVVFQGKLKNEVSDELTDNETELLTHPAIGRPFTQLTAASVESPETCNSSLHNPFSTAVTCQSLCVCLCVRACLPCVIDKSEQPAQTLKEPCER